jgi:hypothetical protein
MPFGASVASDGASALSNMHDAPNTLVDTFRNRYLWVNRQLWVTQPLFETSSMVTQPLFWVTQPIFWVTQPLFETSLNPKAYTCT